MELWAEIRRAVLVEKQSKRSVCRDYGIHWDTLKKILANPAPPGYSNPAERKKPVVGPYLGIIDEILALDGDAPKKQRHTAKRIFERLRDEYGYKGTISPVGRYVAKWKAHHQEVFVPLAQPPGEAQFDFGHADAVIAGEKTKLAFAVMSLPYSDAFYVRAYARETTEAFVDAHIRAFDAFGGVPTKIAYDNSKIAVAKVVGHKGRKITEAFGRLASHFLFAYRFCAVRRGNEKGHVENLVGYSRRNFMVPVPEAHSIEALNTRLEHACKDELARTVRGQVKTKAVLLEEERSQMLKIPDEAFLSERIVAAKANSLSLVRFDKNDYSVPVAYAHHEVEIRAGVDKVRIAHLGVVVATHDRIWSSAEISFDPIHYLALLERKPGALDFAKPLSGWDLPADFMALRRRLESEWDQDGTREYIKVLRLLEHHPPGRLKRAVSRAISIGAVTADAIRLIAEASSEQPVPVFSLDSRPHLKPYAIDPPDINAYAALRDGASK